MLEELQAIIGKFQVSGLLTHIVPIEVGHINETYQVTLEERQKKYLFVLQKINTSIFKRPYEVTHNTANVGHFLEKKEYPKEILIPINTIDNQYVTKMKGNYWRLFPFVQNTKTYNEVTTEEQAYAAAFAFGEYTSYLNDFDATTLNVTIPDFHNTNLRYQQFLETLQKTKGMRKSKAREVIENLHKFRYLLDPIRKVQLPLRVTHNDTKINNILFDKTNVQAVCVIDLDTLMPGTLLYDYGDMVRTFTPVLDENSADFKQIYVRKEILKALTAGYIAGLDGKLTDLEEDLLLYGGKLTIFEQTLRFLTDYLQGDIYYKVTHPEQNLIRTKNQLCLLESLIKIGGG